MALLLSGIVNKDQTQQLLKDIAPDIEAAGIEGYTFVVKDDSCKFSGGEKK
jgi:hypothetical protein